MKKVNLLFQLSTITSLLIAGFFTFALAQDADTENKKQKLTIDIEVIENGKVTKISKEVDATDGQDIHQILRDLDVMDDLDIRGTGQKLEIRVRKEMQDDEQKYIDVNVHSPDTDEFEWFDPSFKCRPRPLLGVHITSYEADRNDKGALVTSIVEESAAEKAGLKEGDVITKINDTEINSDVQLREEIGTFKVGDRVKVTFSRDGKVMKIEAVLGESKAEVPFNFHHFPNAGDHFFQQGNIDDQKLKELLDENGHFNLDFDVHTDDETAFLGVMPKDESADVRGVALGKVIEGSTAEKMGLKADDVILKLDGNTVNSFGQLAEVISAKKAEEEISVEYERDGKTGNVTGELGKRADAPHAKRIIHFNSDKGDPSDRSRSLITKEVNVVIELKDCTKEEAVLAAPAKVDFGKELGINRIEFSPNPSNGQFQLNFELPEHENTRVMVLDGMGRKVHEELLNNFEGQYSNRIDIGSQPNGVYFLIIAQGDKQFTRKIVKQ